MMVAIALFSLFSVVSYRVLPTGDVYKPCHSTHSLGPVRHLLVLLAYVEGDQEPTDEVITRNRSCQLDHLLVRKPRRLDLVKQRLRHLDLPGHGVRIPQHRPLTVVQRALGLGMQIAHHAQLLIGEAFGLHQNRCVCIPLEPRLVDQRGPADGDFAEVIGQRVLGAYGAEEGVPAWKGRF